MDPRLANYSVSLTQEVEFGGERQSISIGNKRVVACVVWLHVINSQPMIPGTSQREKQQICLLKYGRALIPYVYLP